MAPDGTGPAPASPRTRVRRSAARGRYDTATIQAILDGGLIAHVGVDTPEGPLVLPMAYGRDDEWIYLHGAAANHLLASAGGAEVCVTVTHVDGLVMARTPFHNSMNYRSVVIRGRAEPIEDPDAKARALRLVTDHVVANWDLGRPVSASDVRKTSVVRVPLTEASAKVRAGDPVDEPEDMAGPWWAGLVPVQTRFGAPAAAADLTGGHPVPEPIAALADRAVDDRA